MVATFGLVAAFRLMVLVGPLGLLNLLGLLGRILVAVWIRMLEIRRITAMWLHC